MKTALVKIKTGGKNYIQNATGTARALHYAAPPLQHPRAISNPAYRISEDVKTVHVHHLVPGLDEIVHEFFLRIIARINLGKRTQL